MPLNKGSAQSGQDLGADIMCSALVEICDPSWTLWRADAQSTPSSDILAVQGHKEQMALVH
eukprot:CAMPEP_0206136356 /NCGR_PEP_ID=MMETSP1473-20131121/1593_1 /ASSEMBLY_ACC=CAM_ASM_001109 /TAXON_ID=1461547 /ORGANISM="Stichococcus sp, Strain RCC1054" /LENGTH=60 /DNA_ID=CAMNT_0053528825 /DNA_START=81 /DNA_END=260 /DNA_ORIENTATION=-